ncbi:MAG: hypothetical protein ABI810_08685 [Sphingomonas bacterium]
MRYPSKLGATIALLASAPAGASCAAAAQYNFLFSNQAAATLAYGSTYSYTASTSGGLTRGFTMTLGQNGVTSTVVASTTLPAINTLVTGTDATKRDLVIGGTFSGRTADITSATRVITVTFTFTQPVRDFSMSAHDVDFGANQFRDWMMITGTSAAGTYTPSIVTPWGTSNATGGTRSTANSSVTLGANTTPLTLTAAQFAGTGASDPNSDDGTITASFAQPVTSVTLRYGNAPFGSGENTTGQQATGISGISFCPMPVIAVAKTSTPIAGTLGAYNLPGNDLTYTLTVTNSGSSPVDAGTINLIDLLPGTTKFRNTVLSGGLPFSIASGTSGVTLAAGAAAYSNNGGSTWSYAPASGYDAAVNALKIVPSGTMAANSSFTISFVSQIK